MKIDEDLIYQHYERIRDELVIYMNMVMTRRERNDHGQNILDIVKPFKSFISELKMEQMDRDSYLDEEIDKLNQERIKYFEF